MSASTSQRARSRYRTPLPFSVPGYEEAPPLPTVRQQRNPYQVPKGKGASPPLQRREDAASRLPRSLQRQYTGETSGSSGSNTTQAAIQADSWLPYARPKSGMEIDQLLAELEMDQPPEKTDSTSSDRTTSNASNSTNRTVTHSSRTSDPPSNPSPDQKKTKETVKNRLSELPIPQRKTSEVLIPQSPPRREPQLSPQPPARHFRSVTGTPQARERAQSTAAAERPSRAEERQTRMIPRSPSPEARPRPTRLQSTTTFRQADIPGRRTQSLTTGPKPPLPNKSSRRGLRRPPSLNSVEYEFVDGVKLNTRPKSAREHRGGLSIPEIEARDIRNIPDRTPDMSDDDREHFRHRRYFAQSPPPVGAKHSHVHSISPKPVQPGEDHVLLDRYCRAADDEMPNQRADPPAYRQVHSVPDPAIPTTLYEQPVAEESKPDIEEGAEPPSVNRVPNYEEREAAMDSRTHQAKNLLSGMLKGFSSSRKQEGNGDEMNDGQGPVPTREFAAAAIVEPGSSGSVEEHNSGSPHGRTRWHSSSEDSDGTDHTKIWSPTSIRRSIDGFKMGITH